MILFNSTCRFNQKERKYAAMKIQAYWRAYQDRRLFKLMKCTILVSEHCLAPAVLRKLSPQDAELVRDPTMHCKVRFRFSGSQFPPVIVFKIYHVGKGGQYICGKSVFRPSVVATSETCKIMGSRTFCNHIIADEIQRQGRNVADPFDITCMRDYMQYSSHLDELPSYHGGRENSWRSLTLQGLSRNLLCCDGLESGGKETVGDRLRQELLSLSLPLTPCSLVREKSSRNPRFLTTHSSSVVSTAHHISHRTRLFSTRRSAQACSTAAQMRNLYIPKEEDNEMTKNVSSLALHRNKTSKDLATHMQNKGIKGGFSNPTSPNIIVPTVQAETSSGDSDSEWEKEADRLCTWTKHLVVDDIDIRPANV